MTLKYLIKSAYEFGARYLVNWKNKLYFTNKQPTKIKNICDENDYFFQWEPFISIENQGTIIINVDWCKSFLPFVKENDFIVLEELLEK